MYLLFGYFLSSLLYIQDLCNSYKNIQEDRIKKAVLGITQEAIHFLFKWITLPTSGGHNICLTEFFSAVYQVLNHTERWGGSSRWDMWFLDPPINLTPWFSPLFALSHLFSAHDWPHTNKWLSCPLTTWSLYLWQLAFRVNKKLISNDKISNPSKKSDNLHGEIFHMQVLEDISEIIMG